MLHSLETAAREREKAAIVIQSLIVNNLAQEIDLQLLVQSLLKMLRVPKHTAIGEIFRFTNGSNMSKVNFILIFIF